MTCPCGHYHPLLALVLDWRENFILDVCLGKEHLLMFIWLKTRLMAESMQSRLSIYPMSMLEHSYLIWSVQNSYLTQQTYRKKRHQKILREVRGLRQLDQPTPHKSIVRYYGCWMDKSPTDGCSNELPWKDIGETMSVALCQP